MATKKSLGKASARGFGWMFGGRGVYFAVNMVVLVVLARLLDPAEFGLIGAAMLVVDFCNQFSQIGVSPYLVQREEIHDRHIRVAWTCSLLSGLLVYGGILLLEHQVARFFNIPELAALIPFVGVLVVLQCVQTVVQALLQRNLKFKQIALWRVIGNVFGYGIVSIGCALAGLGVWSLVWGRLAQNSVQALGYLATMPFPKRPLLRWEVLKEMASFGGGVSLQNVFNYFGRQGDYIIVGRYLGATSLGLYTRAYKLMELPVKFVGQSLHSVLFPVLSKMQNDDERMGAAFVRVSSAMVLFSAAIGSFVGVLAPEIVSVMLGDGWEGVILPLQVLGAATVFRGTYKISSSVVLAKGAVYKGAVQQGVYAACVLGFVMVGKEYGIVGAAIGALGAVIVHYILLTTIALRLVRVSWFVALRRFISPIALALANVAVVVLAAEACRSAGLPDMVTLVCASLSGALFYGAVFFARPSLFGDDVSLLVARALAKRRQSPFSARLLARIESQTAA
ncbi:MAG: lipopolysaccharide biosynthesis protein [Bacteroidota bacterium]